MDGQKDGWLVGVSDDGWMKWLDEMKWMYGVWDGSEEQQMDRTGVRGDFLRDVWIHTASYRFISSNQLTHDGFIWSVGNRPNADLWATFVA